MCPSLRDESIQIFPQGEGGPRRAGSIEVKDLRKRQGDGAMIRVARHDRAHVAPPAAANLGLGDGRPAFLVLDLHVGKELPRLGMQEDGIFVDAVSGQHVGQFAPDRLMPPDIFGFLPGVHAHDEGFADHARHWETGRRFGQARASCLPGPA